MMRSLFSGVSGLKTHQTRMDVIGNNIANVNTTAYKSQNMVFSDLLYQQTQAASGANANTGRGGTNPRQIGLGAKTAAINTAITRQGSAQSTNNPWDVMISGESFFIVNSGSQNFFTRDGSFTIDGAGNLVMASTGYKVMGWQVDEETGDIRSDVVSALQVMNRDNLIADPEYTTNGYASGIVDKLDTAVHSKAGKVMTLNFFDGEGYSYTAMFSIHAMSKDGNYYVQLDDIINSEGESLKSYYHLNDISQVATFGGSRRPIDPVNEAYSVPEGVTYQPVGGAVTTAYYKIDCELKDILKGYSENPLMKLAKDVDITKIGTTAPPTEGLKPSGDGSVTVSGNAELTEEDMIREYGLVRLTKGADAGKYYYKKADGTEVVLENDPAGDATELGKWKDALAALGGGGGTVDLSAVKVDEDGKAVLTFTGAFAPDKDGYYAYNESTGNLSETIEVAADGSNNDAIKERIFNLVDSDSVQYNINYIAPDGQISVEINEFYNGNMLVFNTDNGKFEYIGSDGQNAAELTFSASATDLTGENIDLGHFHDISIDFSSLTNVNNGKVSTASLDNGDGSSNNLGSGRKRGELIGVEIGQDGKITASYDNGLSKLLGQIAVTKFANASGLAKVGNNLYNTTMNSGDFDGIGMDITSDGEGSMESGVLEMSNVDLAGEFTEMITTQRGFQANSRIITTSDSMLEELVNLKR